MIVAYICCTHTSAKLDLESAKVLKDKQLYHPAIYHLQQAYEKSVKSYFILKEVKITKKQLLIIKPFVWGMIRKSPLSDY